MRGPRRWLNLGRADVEGAWIGVMAADEKAFRKGEIVFREGDDGDAVYIVAEGRIELFKTGPSGPAAIVSLGAGQMFGETGVLDEGPRSVTAVAASDCILRVIDGVTFRARLRQDPDVALHTIKLLVGRLRQAHGILGQQFSGRLPMRGYRGGLIQRLRRLFSRRRPAMDGNTQQTITVAIAAINNDVEGAWARALADLFSDRTEFTVRAIPVLLPIEPCHDQSQIGAMTLRTRQALADEGGADLLISGDVHADGFSLMFTPARIVDEDRPGAFGPYLVLELAGSLEPPVGDLLALACLAAFEPADEAQKSLQRSLLPAALQALDGFPDNLPADWNGEQARSALAVYGHAAATIAGWEGDVDWYDHAAQAYRGAIERLTDGDTGLERALLYRDLGMVLVAAGEKRQDMAQIEAGADAFRTSVEWIARNLFPQEWAAAQNRLGLALGRLDHLTSQPDLLKEALGAFQSALQVYTRADAPMRWADAMFNLSKILLVYGDQAKSVEVLDRAVDAARAALDYHGRERDAAAWAAGRNLLGTALFLLDKHGRGVSHAAEASEALTDAATTYRALGAVRLAETAERNLAHVQRLAKSYAGRDGEKASD